ncbi:hypothetical protein HZS_7807, partial [Henneguya salminicola]
MFLKYWVSIVVLFILSSKQDDEESYLDPDVGGFVKNVFSRLFSSWPFKIFDEPDYFDMDREMGIFNDSNDSLNKMAEESKIEWEPIDLVELCKNESSILPVCGKKSVYLNKICKHIERGASVKGFCRKGNNSEEDSSMRITINYIRGSQFRKNGTISSFPESTIEEKIKLNDSYELPKLSSYFYKTAINNDSKPISKRDNFFSSKYEKTKSEGYNLSMYGIAMSSGALGTVLIILLIVIIYSIVRVIRIKKFQTTLGRANEEVCLYEIQMIFVL